MRKRTVARTKPNSDAVAESIRDSMLRGETDSEITNRMVHNGFTPAEIQNAQGIAMERFRQCADVDPKLYLGFVLEAERFLYSIAVQQGDTKVALSALDGLRKTIRDIDPYREFAEGEE